MSEPNALDVDRPARSASLAGLLPLAALIVVAFIVLLFPWDSLGRRVAWEISRVSGARVDVSDLSPAITARGPVLRARNVVVEHPAVDRLRLSELEIAPRLSMSWFRGDPTLRVWAQTDLGHVDGVLRLGDEPAYVGRVTEVELARLPLRLEASELRFSGRLDADADVALDPNGTLQGRVAFESPSLSIQSSQFPMAIPFSHADGVIEIVESGATRIESVRLEGPVIEGTLSGEIGLVHRSQSPPIDLSARVTVHEPLFRQLADGAGLRLSAEGEADVELRGTIDAPEIAPAGRRKRR